MDMRQQRRLVRQKQRQRRERAKRIRMQVFAMGMVFLLGLELLIAGIAPYAMRVYRVYFPKREDGHITRKISEIMPYLEAEPEDIESQIYKSQIPAIIQRDIDKMLASQEELYIVYESENGLARLIIEKDEYGEGEFQIRCEDIRGYFSIDVYPIKFDVSFYKTEKGISVYGRNNNLSRCAYYYTVREERSSSSGFVYEQSIDCFGVPELKDKSYWSEEDNYCMWEKSAFLSLVRLGNEFKFYNKGQQCGETITFPGADIVKCTYDYILDANQDMYYMYYCTDRNAPWVQFVKVAENVDKIEGTVVFKPSNDWYNDPRYDGSAIRYPTYIKNGKEYVAMPDEETERAYGQKYGIIHDISNAVELNYNIQTVEISEDNIKEINLSKGAGSYFNIYVKMIYGKDTDLNVYHEHTLRGIDSSISEDIPEAEINALLGTIKPEEYETTVQALKALYQKYE